MNVFNKHAPLKYKYLGANDCPFINRNLCKVIMICSKLRNTLNKVKLALHIKDKGTFVPHS